MSALDQDMSAVVLTVGDLQTQVVELKKQTGLADTSSGQAGGGGSTGELTGCDNIHALSAIVGSSRLTWPG